MFDRSKASLGLGVSVWVHSLSSENFIVISDNGLGFLSLSFGISYSSQFVVFKFLSDCRLCVVRGCIILQMLLLYRLKSIIYPVKAFKEKSNLTLYQ